MGTRLDTPAWCTLCWMSRWLARVVQLLKVMPQEQSGGRDLSAEVGGLVMAPAVQLARNQLLAGAMPTHPPHAGLGPSAQWIPLRHKDTLWGSRFPLPSEEAVGFPKLCLGGVPGCIRLLPKLPPGSPCRQRHLREEPLLGQGGGLSGSLANTCSCSSLGS